MKEVTFTYFLNGKKVEQNEIDWQRTATVRSKDGEVHVKYMSYMLDDKKNTFDVSENLGKYILEMPGYNVWLEKFVKDNTKETTKGFSTRFKSATEYPGGILGIQEEIGTPATPYQRTSTECGAADELRRPNTCLTMDDFANVRKTSINPRVDYDAWNKFFEVGVKHNKHKAPLDIVQTRQFPKALQLLALATAYGNKKYEATDKDYLNFKRVDGGSQTYFDAAARHSVDRFGKDRESGLPHIIHAVWDNMAALEMWAEENKIDLEDFSKKYLENLHK